MYGKSLIQSFAKQRKNARESNRVLQEGRATSLLVFGLSSAVVCLDLVGRGRWGAPSEFVYVGCWVDGCVWPVGQPPRVDMTRQGPDFRAGSTIH